MAKFFIDRPIFAIALSLIIVFAGLISGFNLPIAQYPNITKPQVRVETTYVGANASTVEESIAQAIEQKVNGVENMLDMRSTSTNNGSYTLDVLFNLEKNGDIASVEVQNRVDQAKASLPSEVTSYGVTTAKQSSQTIMYLALTSPGGTYDAMFLKAYGSTNIVDPIKRVKGVSSVSEYGAEYAMRVELKPDLMAKEGVTVSEVETAIEQQNIQAPVGSIGSRPTTKDQEFKYAASTQGRLKTPEEFGNIIVRASNGSILKLKDIAKVYEGARMDTPFSYFLENGKGGEAIVYPISLTTDANALDCVSQIKEVIADAETRFPPDMRLVVASDKTQFVRESLIKVAHTFVEALILVLIVVYLFLGNFRATLVPMLAVPVSLIGTFAAFQVLGFSINTLSLFAMILAIGLVVDDAIVVVEAVEHHIQDTGLSPREATYRAMKEVSGPVVAIACVLAAVFVPISFMSGSTGQLYKQFALTISVSMALSALVALSLTPALCAKLLKPQHAVTSQEAAKGILGKIIYRFNVWYNNTLEKYTRGVRRCIAHSKLVMLGLVLICVLAGVFFKITPTGYVPDEDQGMFLISFNMQEGASSNRGAQSMVRLAQDVAKIDGIKYIMPVSGFDILSMSTKSSAGILPVMMEEYDKRTNTVSNAVRQVYALAAKYPEMTIMAFPEAALPGLSSTGSLSMYVMNLAGDDVNTMNTYATQFVAKANQRPEIAVAYTTFNTDTPAYKFNVDREKAESLNVPVSSVFTTLQAFLGGSEVNDFNNFGRTWKVVVQAQPEYRDDVKNMRFFFVKSNEGNMVPLDTLVTAEPDMTVPSVSRFNGSSAFKIAGTPADGYSTGQAMAALEEIAKEVLPTTYTYQWVDQSRDELEAGNQAYALYAVSLVFVFLVLCALYESWTIPIAVLLSVPPAVLGCLASQYFRGQQNDVYMQVAMIMLIGLAAKNAILIVEYAKMYMEGGKDVVTAAVDAAHLRLRPILMTSFAFILGCLPLAIATGPGAGARVSMGNAVVGGMTFNTFVGVFLIPVLFVVVERFFSKTPDLKGLFRLRHKKDNEGTTPAE
ncbi:MAG: efflux RND transporter permease subunit [Succiniclasticum sp.]